MSNTVIPLRELRVGAVLPAAIYDAHNSNIMLLNRGLTLTRENIDRLQRRGIRAVAIDSRHVNSVIGNGAPAATSRLQQHLQSEQRKQRDSTRQPLTKRIVKPAAPEYNSTLAENISRHHKQHVEQVTSFYDELRSEKRVRIEPIRNISIDSVDMLLSDVDLFVRSAIIPEGDSSAVSDHSCRVAKLAMTMATMLDFPEEDVCQIGIGCMVSRVGITPGIRQLMEVARELTPAERLELKKYPAMTWHTLERITDMSNIARQVAWQINERWNGSGYPRGRVGKQIHPLARLAAVSDVFIALTSDRPYRKALSAYGAVMEVVSSAKQGLFEPAAVRALLRTTCLFPIGSYVELTDGSLARVIRNDPEFYDQPIVQPLFDFRGDAIQDKYVNLRESEELNVCDALSEEEAHRRMHRNAIQNRSIDLEMDWADQLAID